MEAVAPSFDYGLPNQEGAKIELRIGGNGLGNEFVALSSKGYYRNGKRDGNGRGRCP